MRNAKETGRILKMTDDSRIPSDNTRFCLAPFHHALCSVELSFAVLFERILGATCSFLSKFHRRWSVSFQSLVKERACSGKGRLAIWRVEGSTLRVGYPFSETTAISEDFTCRGIRIMPVILRIFSSILIFRAVAIQCVSIRPTSQTNLPYQHPSKVCVGSLVLFEVYCISWPFQCQSHPIPIFCLEGVQYTPSLFLSMFRSSAEHGWWIPVRVSCQPFLRIWLSSMPTAQICQQRL
jgi:hypothetical protein